MGGFYTLGASLGNNADAVRAAERKGQKAGFEKGRQRTFRPSYAAAKRRANRTEEAVQQQAATATTATEASSVPGAASSADSGGGSANREPCTYGEGMCTPEENAQEGEAERICGPGGAEAKARPDLCGPGE